LDNKVNAFREQTQTRKTLFLTFVTSYGVKHNDHYTGRVHAEVKMESLFTPL